GFFQSGTAGRKHEIARCFGFGVREQEGYIGIAVGPLIGRAIGAKQIDGLHSGVMSQHNFANGCYSLLRNHDSSNPSRRSLRETKRFWPIITWSRSSMPNNLPAL